MRALSRVVTVVRSIPWAVVLASVWLALTSTAYAASPGPTAGPGGDPRSSGQGPGLVGDPLAALVAVLAIGLGALVLTLVYLRITARTDV
ncbi:MAG: hypothetical protein WEE50_10950 [Chloroflexota bacterium]